MNRGRTLTLVLSILLPILLLIVLGQNMVLAAGEPDPVQARASSDQSPAETAVTDSVLAPLAGEADLGIVKAGDPVSVIAGEKLTYTLTISNNGTTTATFVVLTDTLPAGLIDAVASKSQGSSCSAGPDFVCPMGDLPVGASAWVTIVATVNAGFTGTLENKAGVTTVTTETNTVNNFTSLDTDVLTSADLFIGKSDQPDPIAPGDSVTYTLTITNNGPSDAAGVVVTDTLPLSTTLVSVTPSAGVSCSEGATTTCNLSVLPAGDTITVSIVVSADEGFTGVLQNDAEVSSSTPDPDDGNNTASEDTTVQTAVDLTIDKSADPDPAVAGANLTYNLVITNSGGFPASNVVVTDVLPAETTVVTATASQGSCVPGSTVTCTLGVIGADSTATVAIQVIVDSSATGTLVNTAKISTETNESDETNNDVELVTPINISADMSIGKVPNPDPAVAGGLLTYSLLVKNEGPSDATGITVADTLPVSTTFVSANVIQEAAIIQSVDTSLWDPFSPDPAGITYIPSADRLMVSDSELEEDPFNLTNNLFESSRHGALVNWASTLDYSREPNGLAYDPDSDTLYVSDDAVAQVHVVQRSSNSHLGSFSTSAFGNPVPEGLAYDTHRNHLYSIDGQFANRAVFDISPGINGDFLPPGDVISFSLQSRGISDPEGIAYNPETQTIWVGDFSRARVIETTIDGTVLRQINFTPDNIRVSGLTIAPSSANPAVLSLYITDRGIDNDQNDEKIFENDGKLYELVFPSASSPGGSCIEDAAVVDCDLDDIPAGEWALVSIVVQVDLLASGFLTNTATVSAATPDGDAGNDTHTITTPITTTADLSLTKFDDPDPVAAGERLTYTLVVSNSGPSIASMVKLEDTLPPSTTISSTHSSHGLGCDDKPNLECQLLDILPGTQATVTIIVDVAPNAPPSLTNIAEVKSLTFDNLMANNFVSETTTVTTSADLAIAKANWPNPATAGETLTYTLVVTNLGPSDAIGVVVTDTLPGGVSLITANPSQGTGCSAGSAPTCTLGFIPPNATASVTIVVSVTSSVSTTLMNVADVAAATADPFPQNNHYELLTAVESVADLSLEKLATPEPATAGTALTYTLAISNAGPSVAYGVVLTDFLPPGVSYLSATSAHGIDCSASGQVTCQLDPLAAGQEILMTMLTAVDPNLTVEQFTNYAEIASQGTDLNETNNTDSFTSTVQTVADLTITKTASVDPVAAGEILTYTLTVENLGPSSAISVTVTDTLPSGVTYLSLDAEPLGDCAGGAVVTCEFAGLAPMATAVITIGVQVDPATLGTLENTAEVSSFTSDGDPENNSFTLFTTAEAGADLSIGKAGWPETVTAGTSLTYTLIVSNSGPSDAVNVVMTDTLPTGVTLLSSDAGQGNSCGGDAVVTCTLGTMAPGAQATITLRAGVASSVSVSLHNVAEVAADTADPILDNNEATVDTAVVTSADVSLTKEASSEPVYAGAMLTYTLTIANAGPSDAANVVVTDTLPGNVTLIAAESSQGPACDTDGQVVCQLGMVPANQQLLVTITTSLDPALSPQLLVNRAGVSTDTSDPDATNNGDILTSTVETAADLAVTKAASPEPVTAGENLTYTLTVHNLGPSNASGIWVTDTLPLEATLVYSDVSQGDCTGTTQIVCDIGDLSALASAEITIVVTIDAGASGVIENVAEVNGDQQDPDTENNLETVLTSVNREGSLPLSLTDDPDPVIAGTILTYSLVVTSAGPSDATGVVLTDTLPQEVQFLTVTHDVGNCEQNLGVVVCNLGNMTVGTEAALEILVLVDTDALGEINNQAVVTADGATPSAQNVDTLVNASADLGVTNNAEPNPVIAGGQITFNIDVINNGPSMARLVEVVNDLPAGTSFNTSPDCVPSSDEIICSLGDMDHTETVSTYFVVDVATDAIGIALSEATVQSETFDPEIGNNNSFASTKIVAPPVYLPLILYR
ncbi:MAG: DUF11 domain-containing protein [Chloroflexota bacterium]|nr:MAG: DUF11 domain-containing protein [Chloroflexota bacterium]